MARIRERIARLESQIKPAALSSLTEEEKAFIGQCSDWIRNKIQPDLSALTDWQKEMYDWCVRLVEEYS